MKSVLISIRPKWCEKIANGEKTIEVRKTRPKLDLPFKCYIYCTKNAKTQFWTGPRYSYADDHSHNAFDKCGSGKVIGEFVCDDIFERIVRVGSICEPPKYYLCDWDMSCTPIDGILSDACLTLDALGKYLDGGVGYGWHISDLKIYDTPRELSEFTGLRETRFGAEPVPITRPPQSWCYVEEQAWNG